MSSHQLVEIETLLESKIVQKCLNHFLSEDDLLIFFERSIELYLIVQDEVTMRFVSKQRMMRAFPCLIRDCAIVEYLQEKYVLVYLQSGVVMIFNKDLELIRNARVVQHSFDEKPAPVLDIGVSRTSSMSDEKPLISLQITEKRVNLFKLDEFLDNYRQQATAYEFNEPHHNTILDFKLMQDWRRASEDYEERSFQTVSIVTLTLEQDSIYLINFVQPIQRSHLCNHLSNNHWLERLPDLALQSFICLFEARKSHCCKQAWRFPNVYEPYISLGLPHTLNIYTSLNCIP
ncbi:hypothetical protein FGO68_gene2788 [Halteria grandinella]|uniref:Uncharacterized protein n=1 Tax=Halteria grandinella TaxID=5974 RepID=A0A8J8NEW7_HALGN|nr:hypothetical protein FGO68_gene2788 [Halteria grandinella]